LNPAPAQPLPTDLLRKVDYLIPNQTELAQLAYPDQPNPPDTLQPAAQLVQEMGVKNLLVTLGSDGVLVIDRQHTVHLPAYTVPVVDSVAAGDAFVGAFAVALSEGKPVLEAARWGNAAGALSVTRHGAQPSLPTRAELTQFLSKVTP
ncbi:MAG: PfkB family carbohydrate kinase, partial [Anaerolineaceae bacterium]|nr:PfkB family carbohydrate kinase [Anaerolineaceae bacterium]